MAGSDRLEYLRECCSLVYLDRTPGISTTQVKCQPKNGPASSQSEDTSERDER